MKARATITIEPEILEKTRGLAQKRRTNVSKLIENLLSAELAQSTDLTDKLIGSAALREAQGETRFKTLAEKYLTP